jgi:hypothetical protein
MEQDANGSFLAVEIVTKAYVVVGRCTALIGQNRLIDLMNSSDFTDARITDAKVRVQTRLVDVLNSPDFTHLQITDAKVRGLANSGDVIAVDGPLFLDKERIVFASTLESPQEAAERRDAHRVDQVEKDKHPVLVFASPFRILGNAHLAKGADLRIALPRMFDAYLALTETKAVHENNNGLAWENDFIAVNGKRIDMVCSSPPQLWRAEPFAARGEAHTVDEQELQDVFGYPV